MTLSLFDEAEALAAPAGDAAPIVRELASETDFDGFRAAARELLRRGVEPARVRWRVATQAEGEFDFGAVESSAADEAPAVNTTVRVPPDVLDLARQVALHRDPERFGLIYRLLWRLQRERGLHADPLDADMTTARRMAQAVRRDIHKMRAFVRFRPVHDGEHDGQHAGQHAGPGHVLHVAWFEPDHHIVQANADFFRRRFAGMRWAILAPEASLHWNGRILDIGPGAAKADAPAADDGEALWLAYYRSIFNPARLKLAAMENEMPRRYWRNLPEAVLIAPLAQAAHERQHAMIEAREPEPQAPALPRRRIVPIRRIAAPEAAAVADATAVPLAAGGSAAERLAEWQRQRAAAASCRECPIGELATQTVWGEGAIGARLMLVGEQPGDREDLEGRPFVGPAGQLLARAMADLGWPREGVYVTNAVKHFKYEVRGRRRMHKTAAQREADACLHWLEAEIDLVRPEAIVALGATAARQLLGRPVAVMRERGQWLERARDGRRVVVTLHPSALLRSDRGEPAELEAAYARWVGDLRLAGPV